MEGGSQVTTIGLFDAKTRLSALVKQAERGETILITVHGRPAAKLVSAGGSDRRMAADAAVAGLLEFRRKHRLGDLRIRDLVDEGRSR